MNKQLKHSQLPVYLQHVLPADYTYIFTKFQIIHHDNSAFSSTIFTDIHTEEEAKQWISTLEHQTDVTYRITRGVQTKGQKIIYKTIRHCQHKRKQPVKTAKHSNSVNRRDKKTNCPATLTMKIHNNKHHSNPCEINIVWQHNHSIQSAHALSFKPVSERTKRRFFEYFEQGHSPASAKQLHELNLTTETEEEYAERMHADRSINPTAQDVYYLFRKWREERYGKESGQEMFYKLESIIKAYNDKHQADGGHAFLRRYISGDSTSTSQPLVLAVCTPLMARAHQLIQQSGELVYCDSTSSLDRYNCPLFTISTSCSAGGIPLAVVITSSETEATITEALTVMKTVIPSNAFYGRKELGPELCITDDCAAERAALKAVWPNTNYLLCIFHYLQCWWLWLMEAKQRIPKDERQSISNLIRKLVYVKSEGSLLAWYDTIMESTYATKYPHLVDRLRQFWERRSEWALSFRVREVTRGNHTNNYAEGGIRILKEIVFDRVKAYNLIQMFEFLTNTMEQYFSNRLLDIAHSRYRPGIAVKYRHLYKSLDTIVSTDKLSDHIYSVTDNTQHGTDTFLTDMELGVCTCIKGYAGAPCKHQAAVAKTFGIFAVNIPPFHSREARKLFATLAKGDNVMETNFYSDLREYHMDATEDYSVPQLQGHDTDTHLSDSPMSPSMTSEHSYSTNTSVSTPEIQSMNEDLISIVDDITYRLSDGDHNFISGVKKFINSYRYMQQSSVAPSATISYALHNFGKPDSKPVL